jgi:hypothetical protein
MRKALVSTDLSRLDYKEGEWWWVLNYGCKFDQTGQNERASNVTNVWATPSRLEGVYPENVASAQAAWPKKPWKELEKEYGSKFPIGK